MSEQLEINIGDVVMLKTGSPALNVYDIEDDVIHTVRYNEADDSFDEVAFNIDNLEVLELDEYICDECLAECEGEYSEPTVPLYEINNVIHHLANGGQAKRASWGVTEFITLGENNTIIGVFNNGNTSFNVIFTFDDLIAIDWELL